MKNRAIKIEYYYLTAQMSQITQITPAFILLITIKLNEHVNIKYAPDDLLPLQRMR